MKLCIDTRLIFSSGIGVYIREIISELDGYGFEIVCLGYEKVFSGYGFVKLNSRPFSLGEQFELMLKVPECDWFWSPHFNISLFPVRAKKRATTVHDILPAIDKNSFSFFKRLAAYFYIKCAISRSDALFTVSDFSKKEIFRVFGFKENIHFVHNGVRSFFVDDESISNISPNNEMILFVGNVKKHKNLKMAIMAFKILKESFKNSSFYIVGEKDKFTIDNEVLNLAMSTEGVFFTGRISDEELFAYYKQACFMVFPSTYEGFGLPVLEAQSNDCPVAASNIVIMKEVLGESVIYFNQNDVLDIKSKMQCLLEDPNLRKSLVQRGRENVKRFSWSKAAFEIKSILEKNSEVGK